ncbi:39S ribosomal protein L3, mitochondrial [Cephus cinctus]|uniref:Large ribosomal subunit protein uL3m n=1 Tax=Cephus cinctus TaxID=211228 RepID=A0AAJ7C2M1_CEPCN|nr:39S ribosomal protein L3, mitochondrial [Cephus cinctus]
MSLILKTLTSIQSFSNLLKPGIEVTTLAKRGAKRLNPYPKKRHPGWLPRPTHVLYKDDITPENTKFIKEVVETRFGKPDVGLGMQSKSISPLRNEPIEPQTEWKEGMRRTGVIAKKIGVYPMWLKDGTKVLSTLLQVIDNHVIRYMSPEEYAPVIQRNNIRNRLGCLIVGAESMDPQLFTKEYCGVFNESGVLPKRMLGRFLISPNAALQPGTPLYAAHFKPGDYVDIRGKTIDRGFQGVMKRWGFKGMPASHGVTKTHRRGGNIGSGGTKARVMPGTKMPGHMGNRWRVFRGIRILRINTKYNVIWALGPHIPGETNSLLYMYDTVLPTRKPSTAPHFPTYLPSIQENPVEEELWAEDVHRFDDPCIEFIEETK